MYNFKRLIEKYSKVKPLLKSVTGGHYDYDNGGVWVDGEVEWIELEAAVLPLGEDLILDNSGYTTDDKKLYTYEELETNQVISYKERLYSTMGYVGYEDYDIGLKIFVLKAGGVND